MKHRSMIIWCTVILISLSLFTTCGKDNPATSEKSTDNSTSVPPSATGTWSFVDPQGNQETIILAQSGNEVRGTTANGGMVQGTANGASYQIIIIYSNDTINLTVTISGNSMSGTVTDGSGGSGSLTAVRTVEAGNQNVAVSDLVGSWAGNYNLIKSGTVYQIQVTLDAAGNVQGSAQQGALTLTGKYIHSVATVSGFGTTSSTELFSFTGVVSGDSMSGYWASNLNPEGGWFVVVKR
jgi:hypothetical protein